MYTHTQRPGRSRRGFTLIEMLVVIAIIAILAAMAAYAVFAMVGSQERRNTESTIKVVYKILQSHWTAVVAEADTDSPSPAVLAMAGGDPARAKIIWRKFRLMEAFPQTYAEITAPFVYTNDPNGNGPYIPAGQQRYNAYYLTQLGSVTAAKNPLTESGACLRLALSVSRGGGSAVALSDDKIKYAIADTDGDGIPELIDSFENPKQALAFFRFAYNTGGATDNAQFKATNPALGKNARGAKFPDPLDPEGTLCNASWVFSGTAPNPSRLTFEMFFHPVTSPYPLPAKTNPPLTGCYVSFVIVSAGPTASLDPTTKTTTRPFGFTVDPKTGYFSSAQPLTAMQPDMSIANQTQANDNIYSFQLTGN